MDYTHIVVTHSKDDKEYLYRASDGMRIGGRQNAVVVYGENPNKSESRVFLTPDEASRYLREVATLNDMTASARSGKVALDIRSGDPVGIVIPDNAVSEEFMGGNTRIRKIV